MSAVLFLGLKGGVGTTRTAIAHARSVRCATLVDLDLAHGDAATRLGVPDVRSTIADLAPLAREEVDADVIRALTYPVPRHAVDVLPSPGHPELAELVSPELVDRLLELAAAPGRTLVVDAGSVVTAQVLAACHRAEEVVLVGRADATCARQATIVHDLMRRARVHAACGVCAVGGRSATLADAAGLAVWRPARIAPWRMPAVAGLVRRAAASGAGGWSR